MSDHKIILHGAVHMGPPCPFTEDPETGSHPKVENLNMHGRLVVVCRHCGQELANQPDMPLLQEPYEPDPRVRIAE